jgi:hypothetical protein
MPSSYRQWNSQAKPTRGTFIQDFYPDFDEKSLAETDDLSDGPSVPCKEVPPKWSHLGSAGPGWEWLEFTEKLKSSNCAEKYVRDTGSDRQYHEGVSCVRQGTVSM